MTNIDHLPVEILMKIFTYLPSHGNASLVNKLFYDVVCKVTDPKICVTFMPPFITRDQHYTILRSIKNTQRKIQRLVIGRGFNTSYWTEQSEVSEAVTVIKKFSATIKYFKLHDFPIKMTDFVQILSLVTNAEHLIISHVKELPRRTIYQPSNKCLKLHKLKKLELRGCSQEILGAFDRLPVGVLKELTLDTRQRDVNFHLLVGLFLQQHNITVLVLLCDSTLPDHIFDHLTLKSLDCECSKYDSGFATILSKQTKLKSLSLREGKTDSRIFDVITNRLNELETLNITPDNESLIGSFENIAKLKKLKNLWLESISIGLIDKFSGLENSRITALKLNKTMTWGRAEISLHQIGALANSLPNLMDLHFESLNGSDEIVAILQIFNFVETLKISSYLCSSSIFIDGNFIGKKMDGTCFNPKLTELQIAYNFPYEGSLLDKLIAIYPNLKKLTIHSSSTKSSITISLFKIILDGFKKLESLELNFNDSKFTDEHLYCIVNHRNILKSITLSNINKFELSAEHKKMLSVVFDVIRFEWSDLHLAKKIT